jgi:uncharacterized protein
MVSSIIVDRDVPMEMRDGTKLRADIYRPNDEQKHPAILSRFMFKTFGRIFNLEIINANFAGYALVSQVCRGRGTSDGQWAGQYSSNIEGIDGYDSVEWIASQKWCDGNVGMLGYSHGGGFTWMAAMENPPHLKAIAPWSSGMAGGQRIGVPMVSGNNIQLMNSLLWMTNEATDVVNRLEREGQDVSEMRRVLAWAQNNPEEYFNFLPLKDMPFARFERIGQMWQWRLHGTQEAGREGEKTYEKVMVPASHLTGWYDGGGIGPVQSFKNMRKLGGTKSARENQHLLVGPWAHAVLLNHLGDINFGYTAATSLTGDPIPSKFALDFFDKYLKGTDIKLPAVRYFVMGQNLWREADDWPPPKTQWHRFFLHSQGHANTASGDGLLTRDEPESEPEDIFVYNPLYPIPTIGGPMTSTIAGFGFVQGPLEQYHIEKRSDVLCYTTPELRDNLEVTGGPLELHIFATTSARSTDFTAKLIDVYPDGRSHNIAEGIVRTSVLKSEEYRGSSDQANIREYVIGMGHTSQLFRKGHRIRIDFSSSNFPLYDRNMNTGNPIGEDAQGIPATQTVYHLSRYASYIELPIMPGKS